MVEMSSLKGVVEFEIKADRFRSGAQSITQQQQRIEASSKKMGQSATLAGTKIDQMAKQGSQNLNRLGQSAQQASGSMQRMGSSSGQAASGMQRMNQSTMQASGSMGRFNAGTIGTAASIGTMGAGLVSLEASMSNYTKAQQKVDKAEQGLAKTRDLVTTTTVGYQRAVLNLDKAQKSGKKTQEELAVYAANAQLYKNKLATATQELVVKEQDLNIAMMDQADTHKLMASSIATTLLGTLSAAAQMISAKKAATIKDTIATKANTAGNATAAGSIKTKVTAMRASLVSTRAHTIETGKSTMANIANNNTFKSMFFDVNKAKTALTSMSIQMKGANLSAKGLAVGLKAVGVGVKGVLTAIGPLGWAIIGITTLWQAWEENLFGFRDGVMWVRAELIKLFDKIKVFVPILWLVEGTVKAVNEQFGKTEEKLGDVEHELSQTTDAAEVTGAAFDQVTTDASGMTLAIDESNASMVTMSGTARQVAEDLGDISERARGLTQTLSTNTVVTTTSTNAIFEATQKIKGLKSAYEANIKYAQRWGTQYKYVVKAYGEDSEEVTQFTQDMIADINRMFGDKVPDTLPQSIKNLMKDAADGVKQSKNEMLSHVQEIQDFLKKNETIINNWLQMVKDKSLDAKTRMLALDGIRAASDLQLEADLSKVNNKGVSDNNAFNKYIADLNTSKPGWYNDSRILNDMYQRFKSEKAAKQILTDIITGNKGGLENVIHATASYSRLTGKTIGGGATNAINTYNTNTGNNYKNTGQNQREHGFPAQYSKAIQLKNAGYYSVNTKWEQIYSQKSYSRAGRKGGMLGYVMWMSSTSYRLIPYSSPEYQARAKRQNIYGQLQRKAGTWFYGTQKSQATTLANAIANQGLSDEEIEAFIATIPTSIIKTRRAHKRTASSPVQWKSTKGGAIDSGWYSNFQKNLEDWIRKKLAFDFLSQTLTKSSVSATGLSHDTLMEIDKQFGGTEITEFVKELKRLEVIRLQKERQAKYDKLKTFASTIRHSDDLSKLGIDSISEAEALTKEFGALPTVTVKSMGGYRGGTEIIEQISFIEHLKQLESKRLAEQRAMQAEIRRMAAEQARIKAEQDRQRAERERLAGIESEIKANPYNVVNILKRLGWTESNLKGLFSRDYNLDEEEERILTIAQIGQREITQQVTT